MANIQESIHRVLNEEYILYHMNHYSLIIPGMTDEYLSPIWARFNQSMGEDALNSQIQAIVKSIEAKGQVAAKPLDIMEALENGALLEEILDGIAGALDSGIQSAWSSNGGGAFLQVLQDAHSLDGLLENGKVQYSKQVAAFFDLVVRGIQAMTGGAVPPTVFTELTKIGKVFGPKSFVYSDKSYDTATPVTMDQLKVIKKIVDYLSNAAQKLQADGKVSPESLRATVTQIFSTQLGEQIGKQMLESAMPNLDEEVLKMSDQILGKNGNIKLVSSNFTKSGTDKTNGKTAKVDLLNSNALSLSLNINGSTTTIDIATNVSVKWYKTKAGGVIPSVSLGSMNMGDLLGQFAGAPRGIAYNIIAHNWADAGGMQKLRSTLAASFVNEWISGSGGLMQNSGAVDKVQMLMVNGKLYTVTALVKKIAGQIPYGDASERSPLRVSFSGISQKTNSWEVSKSGEAPYSWSAAKRRSDRVRGIINGLAATATLRLT